MLPVNDEKPIAASASAGEQQHVISPGETLMGIAMQYKVSMRALRLANNMPDGQLKVGQVLRIPQLGRGI